MSCDRHILIQADQVSWLPECKHCGIHFRPKGKQKYGSNACRQAAYRKRLADFLPLRHKEPLTRPKGCRETPARLAPRKMAKGGVA